MKNPLSIFLLFISFFSCFFFASAQDLKIVKDNIACAYGLKDEYGGSWVVKPQYTAIEPMKNGLYKVQVGFDVGLLDRQGATLLPAVYDDFNMLTTDMMTVSRDRKYGIINRKGAFLVPIAYERIFEDYPGGVILYRLQGQRTWTTYLSFSGMVTIPEIEGAITPFGSGEKTVISAFYGEKDTLGAGLINRQGEIVVARKYDRLSMCNENRVAVTVKRKYGLMDLEGNWIIPPEYYIFDSQTGGIPCLGREEQIWRIGNAEGKTGLMKGNGEVILEPVYQGMKKAVWRYANKNYVWQIWLEGKLGTADSAGRSVIPALYDTLVPLHKYVNNDHNQRVEHIHFLVKRERGYGLVADTGEVAEPCRNQYFLRSYHGQTPCIYFLEGLKVKYCDLGQNPAYSVELELVAEEAGVRIYRNGTNLLPFEVNPKDPQRLKEPDNNIYPSQKFGKYTVVTLKGKQLLFDAEGNRVGKKWFKAFDPNGFPYMTLWTQSGRAALIDRNTSEWFTDTLYGEFNQSLSSYGRIWARKFRKVRWPDYRCGGWMLLDSTGGLVSDQQFDYTFIPHKNTVAASGGYMGIIDSTSLGWKVPPVFGYIKRIADNTWFVTSKSGKMGLMAEDYTLVADTLYDSIEEVFATYTYRNRISFRGERKKTWLLKRGNDEVLMDQDGNRTTDPDEIKRRRMNYVFRSLFPDSINYCVGCIHLVPDTLHDLALSQSHFKSDIYDLILEIHNEHLPCQLGLTSNSGCLKKPIECDYYHEQRHFQIEFLSDSAFSLQVWHLESNYGMFEAMYPAKKSEWKNAVQDGDRLLFLHLGNIFKTAESIETELLRAIQIRDDLDLDCSSPQGLAKQVAGNFAFSKEGILLFLQQHQYSSPIELLVPWERVAAYDHSRWLAEKFQK